MRKIEIADITLRNAVDFSLNFKEKVEIAKQLDKLGADVVETAPITDGKTDIVLLHTISGIVKEHVISCPVGLDEKALEVAADALSKAEKPGVNIQAPVSTVQMEYIGGKKPKMMIEAIEKITKAAKEIFPRVEVSLIDATRADADFLAEAVNTAANSGADIITICDDAGEMLPAEFGEFIKNVINSCDNKNVRFGVICSNELHMAAACSAEAIKCGVDLVKTVALGKETVSLKTMAGIFRSKSASLEAETNLNMTVIENCVKQIGLMAEGKPSEGMVEASMPTADFKGDESIKEITDAIERLGYELSDEDINNVYVEFIKMAVKKKITLKDLDAIVASSALQVPPTFKIESFVITNGNIVTPMAHIKLTKNGEELSGYNVGDGPIDAAFRAIDQIVGKHFELDDFQVQSVTRGREALGSAIVKLRSNGKLYAGRGISTDIIGSSINAYINALNKIYFEEEI